MAGIAAGLAVCAQVAGGIPALAAAAGAQAPQPPATQHAPAAHVPAVILSAETAASAVARKGHKKVVVAAETTTSSQVTANPDGTFTLTESPGPVRVKRGGTWVPIDTSLSWRADGSVAPAATATGVVFSGGGSGAMATLTQGSDRLSFTFPAPLPRPVLSGDTATYRDVLPSVDLQLTADAAGFSEVLVVKDRAAAANPELARLTLGLKARGVRVTSLPGGTAEAVSSSGATVFHSDEARMWDSTGSLVPRGGGTSASHASVVGVTTSATAESLVPSRALLAAPSTRYPVIIDPVWSGNPSQQDWARISSNGWNIYNSTSTASGDHPRAGYDNWPGGAGEVARTYYQMNTGGNTGTSGIGGAVVTQADLYLNDDWAASSSDTPVDLYQSCGVSAWTSSGLNWGNKPCEMARQDELNSHENSNGTVSPGTFDFNVTSLAKSAANGDWSNITFEVRAPDEGDNLEWKQFESGGGATLSVTYMRRPDFVNGTGNPTITPSSTDAGTTFASSPTPTLNITAEDTDGENVQTVYQVWQGNSASPSTLMAQGQAPSASSYAPNGGPWTVTSSLPDGVYEWRASTTNPITSSNPQGLWTGWSAWNVFTVDTSAPNPPGVGSPQFPNNMNGDAFTAAGTFTFTNDWTNNVKGYMFSLDGDLGATVYNPGSPPPTWTGSGTPQPGKVYWLEADNGNGTGAEVVNGTASALITPGTTGAHRIYAKAVDQAANTSGEYFYPFYAGITQPTYVFGDQLANGYPASVSGGGTVPVPAATWQTSGAVLGTQGSCCGVRFADGKQAYLEPGTAVPALGDTATMSFYVPSAGYWDIGANLTQSPGYGVYSLMLDSGSAHPATLTSGFDAYNGQQNLVTLSYQDFGIPKDASGAPIALSSGIHTLTLTITGKDAGSVGYKAGIDVLRLGPVPPSCPITNLTPCLDNTAISPDNKTDVANADGWRQSFSATALASAGWTPGAALTIDGAPMTLPSYGVGNQDNIAAGGQTITIPATGVANDGNAIVFLGFATGDGGQGITGATGTITYATNCGTGGKLPATQSYELDDVPNWVGGPSAAASLITPYENQGGDVQDSQWQPRVSAMAARLVYPGCPVASITLPVVSYGVSQTSPALHILAIGIRPSSFVGATSTAGSGYANASNWIGSYGALQDGVTSSLGAVTIRMPAQVSIGNGASGGQVRVTLSNAAGSTPVSIDDASLATQSSGAVPTGTPVQLTFNGASKSVKIPAGGQVTTDPLSYPVAQQATLLVSVHLAAAVSSPSAHLVARTTSYVTAAGTDAVLDATGAPFTASGSTTISDLPYLAGIDVTFAGSNAVGSLVLYGDKTVNSDTSSNGAGVAADLATDLAGANGGVMPYGVVAQTSNGGNPTYNLLPAYGSATQPSSALNPVDRAVMATANVRTVLICAGTRDILGGESATTVENELIALAHQVRMFYTDNSVSNSLTGQLTVYVATIPPDAGFTNGQELVREEVNQVILGSSGSYLNGNADGTIDFAAAVSTTGTDIGATVKPADLSNGNPDNQYYRDLAQQFLTSVNSGTVGVQPNIARIAPLVGS
jgi:hypothetical protein